VPERTSILANRVGRRGLGTFGQWIGSYELILFGPGTVNFAENLSHFLHESFCRHSKLDEGFLLRWTAEWCPRAREGEYVLDFFAESLRVRA